MATFVVYPSFNPFEDFDKAVKFAQEYSMIAPEYHAYIQKGDVVVVRYDRGKEVAV